MKNIVIVLLFISCGCGANKDKNKPAVTDSLTGIKITDVGYGYTLTQSDSIKFTLVDIKDTLYSDKGWYIESPYVYETIAGYKIKAVLPKYNTRAFEWIIVKPDGKDWFTPYHRFEDAIEKAKELIMSGY